MRCCRRYRDADGHWIGVLAFSISDTEADRMLAGAEISSAERRRGVEGADDAIELPLVGLDLRRNVAVAAHTIHMNRLALHDAARAGLDDRGDRLGIQRRPQDLNAVVKPVRDVDFAAAIHA